MTLRSSTPTPPSTPSSFEKVPHQNFLSSAKILISGAGVSGLAFALALHKHWPSATPPPRLVFLERDDSPETPLSRSGYSLSVRSDEPTCGVQTLHKLGLLEKMIANSVRTEGPPPAYEEATDDSKKDIAGDDKAEKPAAPKSTNPGFAIWEATPPTVPWNRLIKLSFPPPKGLPVAGFRIQRKAMRKVLLDAVAELEGVEIRWGMAIKDVQVSKGSSVRVKCGDGEKAQWVDGDYLIACDGASSVVRGLVVPEKKDLTFQGTVILFGVAKYDTPEAVPAPFGEDWGMVLSGAGVSAFTSPMDETRVLWSLSYQAEKPRETGKKGEMSEEAEREVMEEAKRRGGPFGERFAEFVDRTEAGSVGVLNAKDREPFPQDGELPVAFLGDANHAVTPFAGNGANMALADGWDLAERLTKEKCWEKAVKGYDEVAVVRAQKVLKMSRFVIKVAHAKGWCHTFATMFLRIAGWIMARCKKMNPPR